MVVAAEILTFELRRGRVLHGWPLAAVVSARNVVLTWTVVLALSPFDILDLDDLSAPSWVVVRDRGTGKVRARLPAGRGGGSGEELLETVVREADELTAVQLLARHRPWFRRLGRHPFRDT